MISPITCFLPLRLRMSCLLQLKYDIPNNQENAKDKEQDLKCPNTSNFKHLKVETLLYLYMQGQSKSDSCVLNFICVHFPFNK